MKADRVQLRLQSLPGWDLNPEETAIEVELNFPTHRVAMAFVSYVTECAEAADHHPEVGLSHTRVRLSLTTHSEGGLTEKDFELAAQISLL